jgi:CRP-like cAMP-binding protein
MRSPDETPILEQLRAALHTLAVRIGLPAAAIDLLVACIRSTVPFASGREIFGPSDPQDRVHLVVRGAVRVACRGWDRRWVTVQLVEPGGVCGIPWSFDASAPRRFRAVAHGPARVATIDRDAVERILGMLSPPHRLRLLSHGWRAVSGLLVDRCLDATRSLDDRLERQLGALAVAHGVPHGEGRTRIALRLTSKDLGELVVAAPTSVRHAMMRLRDRVYRDRGHLVVRTSSIAGPVASTSCRSRRSTRSEWDGALRAHTRAVLTEISGRSGLTPEAVAALVASARMTWAAGGEELIDRGMEHGDVALVLDGAVRVEVGSPRDGPIVQIVPGGRFVRLTGAAAGGAPRMRAVAHEYSAIAFFDPATVTAALGTLPAAGMLRLFAHTARALSRHLHDRAVLATMPLYARVQWSLATLARDFGETTPEGPELRIALTQGQLARLARSSRSAVCRALRALTKDGSVRVRNGRFVLAREVQNVA